MGCVQSTPTKDVIVSGGDAPAVGRSKVEHPAPDGAGSKDDGVQRQAVTDQGVAGAAAGQPTSTSCVSLVWQEPWKKPPRPLDEEDRWNTMRSFHILDTEPEAAYDSITRLCLGAFKLPIATVSFVDGDRVWFKSVMGWDAEGVHRNRSLCSWVVAARHPTALVVNDLLDDARLCRLPLVTGPPHARFYAGAPLLASNGHVLGSLCLIDTKPRDFSEQDTRLLNQLATLVMKEVERRVRVNDAVGRTILEPEQRWRSLAANVAQQSQAMLLCDVSDPKWPILFANNEWEAQTGMVRGVACGANFWDLFAPLSSRHVQAFTLATKQQRPFQLRLRCTPPGAGDSALDHMQGCPISVGSQRVQMQFWSMNSRCAGSALQTAAAIAIPTLSNGKAAIDAASGRYYWASVIPDSPPPASSADKDLGPASGPKAKRTGLTSSAGGDGNAGGAAEHGCCDGADASGRHDAGGHGGGSSSRCDSSSTNPTGAGAPALGSQADGVESPEAGSCEAHVVSTSGAHGIARQAEGLADPEVSTVDSSFVLSPEPTDAFSDIRLGNLLGKGAYGSVYRGRWNETTVAVKIVDADMRNQPHAVLEPLLHTQLCHPNIVKLYGISSRDVGIGVSPAGSDWLHEHEQKHGLTGHQVRQQEVWMIMEFCSRGTLSDAIARGALSELGPDGTRAFGTINLRRWVSTMREVASAMAYLHDQNVLHGDLTANNVLLVTDRTQRKGFSAKVSDFGLSRLIGEVQSRINTRTHGTITHMAPEVVVSGTHSRKADVYSFGMVMLEGYTGECPFQGMHYAQVIQHVTTGQPLPIPDDAPHDVHALLLAALAHNPDKRPNFMEIHERLCSMEADMKDADANKSPQVKGSLSCRVSETPCSPQAELSAGKVTSTAQHASTTGFDTVHGLVSESRGNVMQGIVEDPATAVRSF